MTEPTLQVAHPSRVEIRYFQADKEAGVKRHYEIRRAPEEGVELIGGDTVTLPHGVA